MSLKQDVEKIASLLERNKTIETSVLWEAFLAFFAMALDHTKVMCMIPHSKVVLLIAAVAPFVLMIYCKGKQLKKNKERKTFDRAKNEFIDDFDNKVCYWVMTASSFCDALAGKIMELNIGECDESIPFISRG